MAETILVCGAWPKLSLLTGFAVGETFIVYKVIVVGRKFCRIGIPFVITNYFCGDKPIYADAEQESNPIKP